MSTKQYPERGKKTKYATSQGFVDYINDRWGLGLKKSRLAKDRMRGIAPPPVARFGNRDLYDPEEQGPEYVAKLVTELKPDPAQDKAA